MRRSERVRYRQVRRTAKQIDAHYWQVWQKLGHKNRPARWRLLERMGIQWHIIPIVAQELKERYG